MTATLKLAVLPELLPLLLLSISGRLVLWEIDAWKCASTLVPHTSSMLTQNSTELTPFDLGGPGESTPTWLKRIKWVFKRFDFQDIRIWHSGEYSLLHSHSTLKIASKPYHKVSKLSLRSNGPFFGFQSILIMNCMYSNWYISQYFHSYCPGSAWTFLWPQNHP